MKKKLLLLYVLLGGLVTYGQVTVSPNPFEMSDAITITVDVGSNDPCNGLVNPTKVYMHSGAGDDSNAFGFDVVGNWGADDGVGEMTNIGGTLWAITITPETYYDLTPTQIENTTQLGLVFRNAAGTQQFYGGGCSDFFLPVGLFQLTLNTPTDNPTIVTSGSSVDIQATTTQSADFTLKADGATVNTQNGITNYSFSPTVNSTTSYVLEATNGSETLSASFQVVVTPTVTQQAIPVGIREGVNYDDADDTKVTLAVRAPNKDYVYIAGSFNNYEFNDSYVMKQDSFDTDLYWLEVTGLTPGQNYTYQYWLVNESPVAGSPAIVKTADPYSPVVLSPFDDPGISNYPNIPTYPAGQEREVTLIQPGATPYNWVVDNFEKPKKEDLVVYEVLVRDFDADRSYQNLIDRIDYFKDLNINAIQLMPIMEFDGNETWGYNTSFHYALDKFYGTPEKFKEFVDLCHQNGIAVILDIALNHATGRNPLVRMWMDDPDGDGWGGPSSENPYFNTQPQHDYNVFNDFNHQSALTQNYSKRVVEHWIEEYKIDGFRWDLTKGFTQNCGPGASAGCTDNYQQDRVDVLKDYADFSWNVDETHYVIFEHLGQDGEEQQWANYRLNDATPKGIMMWGKMTSEYTDFLQGFSSSIARATHQSRGFTAPRLMMYPESHDEERLMYEAVTFGNTSNSSHNVRNLDIALKRMSSIGAVSLTIPGPKMIWHFASLGMDDSIWTCSNGTVSPGNDGCKLDTKPQPQWTENWLSDPDRRAVYDDWSRLIDLKINEDVFEGDFVLEGDSQNVRIFIFDTSIPDGQLKNVVILANFNVTDQNITPDFPFTGTWYNLMDNSTITVNSTTDPIFVPAGEFRIFGNVASTLSTEDIVLSDAAVYPNPANTFFQINKNTTEVIIYNLLGKEVTKFAGNFTENYPFAIDQLETGMYVVRAKSQEGIIVKRLIKK
jgi:1,4-alpha-glucan branching enzyme